MAKVQPSGVGQSAREIEMSDHRRLVRKIRQMDRQDKQIHAGWLRTSASAMINQLLEAPKEDLGIAPIRRWNYYKKDLIEHKTLELPTGVFLHIVAQVDPEEDVTDAVDLFVSKYDDFDIDTPVVRSRLPNFNRDGKIAGFWLGDSEPVSIRSKYVAYRHDAHETAARLFTLMEIPHPEGSYLNFNDVLEGATH